MKVRLDFKTPDVACEQLSSSELEASQDVLDKYLKYGECIAIEFDTETLQAYVIPAK